MNQNLYDHILIRYGELSLKKSNRKQFTQKVNDHIKSSLKRFEKVTFENRGMRYYVHLNGTAPDEILELLGKIPGIFSFSVVARTTSDMESIKNLAKEIILEEDYHNKTFKVETNRGNKSFPYSSIEITKMVSGYLFKNVEGLKADVHNPDFTVNIDVRDEGTFIFTKIYPGLGGLPYGSLGKGLLMISGGIDSIVSGYLSIKKGLEIETVHYASPPYTSDNALQKVVDLLETIVPYVAGGHIRLYVVPFTKIQDEIYKNCRNDYCITIMRRMMYRIAEILAKKKKCLTILNGESVGQVASQTLESINVIEQVATIPVIRPLAMFDKKDIIDIAVKIKSFDISIRPYEDCCTVFVPKHPQIKPKLEVSIEEENKFDYNTLIEEAVRNIQVIDIDINKHYSVFEESDIL